MIDTVIFDIGQVMVGWFPDLEIMFEPDTARIVEKAIWGNEYWNQLDEGIVPEKELFEKMIATAPNYEKEICHTLSHLDQIALKKDYAIPWVKELKEKGYQVYFLSNYSVHLRTEVPEILDFIQWMDGGVFSCDVKLLKPDPAIYQCILEKYQLTPERCLFIDDRLENVLAARESGLHSIQFQSYDETYETIMNFIKES